ncbi:hypothetical protein KY362_00535 [Candidatus Woesearchaeota archaeon]|nr:hypothetical protein [Candidatus Woesearchaeota archaeon]
MRFPSNMGDRTQDQRLDAVIRAIRRVGNPTPGYRTSIDQEREHSEAELRQALATLDPDTYEDVMIITEERARVETTNAILAEFKVDPADREAYLTTVLKLADEGRVEEGKRLLGNITVPEEHTRKEETLEAYILAKERTETNDSPRELRAAALEIMLAEADPDEREDFIDAYAGKKTDKILAAVVNPSRAAKMEAFKKTAAGIGKGTVEEVYFNIFAVTGSRRAMTDVDEVSMPSTVLRLLSCVAQCCTAFFLFEHYFPGLPEISDYYAIPAAVQALDIVYEAGRGVKKKIDGIRGEYRQNLREASNGLPASGTPLLPPKN